MLVAEVALPAWRQLAFVTLPLFAESGLQAQATPGQQQSAPLHPCGLHSRREIAIR